jgi:microcystin-dependent protein
MPYNVNFTDSENKSPITVFDNTSSEDTSLVFPGRNVTGYGQIIAENFLGLLENFASAIEPVNPVEGQLWYDSANGVLQIWDNTNWKAASGIQKGPTEPSVENSKIGELWVDTTNQQLRIYSGTRWILVGPSESSIDGLRYGPAIETIADSNNLDRTILTLYIKDIPVIIISKDSFSPKITIAGFPLIKAGININTPATGAELEEFEGGLIPKLYATAANADALNVLGVEVPAGKFLRSDTVNTTDFGLTVKNNSGVTIGIDSTFNLLASATAAKIYNSATGSSIDLQVNRNGIPNTILRVIGNRVGINKADPDFELDIDGSARVSGNLLVTDITESTNLNNGSFRVAGGAAITKNLLVGDGIDITGITQTNTVQPKATDLYDLGTTARRYNNVRAKKLIAEEITGPTGTIVITGNLNGNANTANNLRNVTSFQMSGDVISTPVSFDGQVGSYTKVFETTLTSNIILTKDEPSPNRSKNTDFILTYRPGAGATPAGLFKQSRDTFIGDLGVPIGAILPFAGSTAPYGYLLCDGSEIERVKFSELYDIIGVSYNGATALNGVGTFRLPDLRGRFPLGRDNMDNSGTVPSPAGPYIDAGGGNVDRVPGIEADTIGNGAGQSSVALTLSNLPEHTHSMRNGNIQYSAIRTDTAVNPPATTGLGPTAPGQAQYLNNSGPVSKPDGTTLGNAIGIMNPYLTLNYIIRSGPPLF